MRTDWLGSDDGHTVEVLKSGTNPPETNGTVFRTGVDSGFGGDSPGATPERTHLSVDSWGRWLRVGAVAFGLGIAVAAGEAVASADSLGTNSGPPGNPRSAESSDTAGRSTSRTSGSGIGKPRSTLPRRGSRASEQQGSDSVVTSNVRSRQSVSTTLERKAPVTARRAEANTETVADTTSDPRTNQSEPGSNAASPVAGLIVDSDSLVARRSAAAVDASTGFAPIGSGLLVSINAVFAVGGRCGLICDGADGTQTTHNGVSGGWLFGNGGAGWSSTVPGVAGGRGGDGGLLWGNAGAGGAGGLGAAGGRGGDAGLFCGDGGAGGTGGVGRDGGAGTAGTNGGRGTDGTAGGDGGAGGNAALLLGRGGAGGASGAGGRGGVGAQGVDAVTDSDEDGSPGGDGGTGGTGGSGGAGGRASLLLGRGGDGGVGGAAGPGGFGGYGGTGGATVITLADGNLMDSDAVGGTGGIGGAGGLAGAGGRAGAGGLFGQAGLDGAAGASAATGEDGGHGGAGGLGGRLPLLDLDSATPQQLELAAIMKVLAAQYEQQTGIRFLDATGQPIGPFNPYLHNPVVGTALFDLASAIASSTLPPRVKEVATLSVGGLWGSGYELYAHKRIAQLIGVPAEVIDSLANGELPDGLNGDELIAAQFARELASTHRVGDATYQAALTAFGQGGLADLVNLIGTYLAGSALFNAFEIQGPEQFSAPISPEQPAPVPGSHQYGLGGRLPLLDLDSASPQQLELAATMKQLAVQYQAQTGIQFLTDDGKLIGPFNGYLQNPVIGAALFKLANAVAASSLSPRVKEVATLAVGGQWGAEYENYAHRIMASLIGLPGEAIDSLASGQPPVGLTGDELVAAQFVQELVSTYQVTDETYHAAELAFGQTGLVDLVNLVGAYLGASAMFNAFEVPAPFN